jgi:hypothetical protein
MDSLTEILGQERPASPATILIPQPKPSPQTSPTQQSSAPNNQTLAAKIASNMRVYFNNPWAMIQDETIFTLDQTDMLNPVKPFPNDKWLEAVTSEWMNNRLVALFKSRRMTITWLMVYLHLWLAMNRPGAAIFFVSDKEEKSDELVKRAEFILKNIPEDMFMRPKYRSKYCYLEFPGLDSYIRGVPQGADQLRQFTATAILADEFAFWEKARETFMASKPTIDGGGKFTAISSPKEGFFKELCFDLVR